MRRVTTAGTGALLQLLPLTAPLTLVRSVAATTAACNGAAGGRYSLETNAETIGVLTDN